MLPGRHLTLTNKVAWRKIKTEKKAYGILGGLRLTTLDTLKPGQAATVTQVGGTGALRHHLLDMGFTPRTVVELIKRAPMGDPIQIKVRGYEITLRLAEAQLLTIEDVRLAAAAPVRNEEPHYSIPHPGRGELDRAPHGHHHNTLTDIPKGAPLRFALVGNQNCGKTTLFNQLTGSSQHVGNFPGVTVDRKDGQIRSLPNARVTDLPGIYSLSPYSNEEIVTRDFLLQTKPDGIINIVDATNLERNLYLTMQLMELGIPMVLALNMMDEVRQNGGAIHINELEAQLGIPVVPIVAAKDEGIEELIEHASHVARHHEWPERIDFCADSNDPEDPVAAVHRGIHAMAHLIEPLAKQAGLPLRFAATKLIEHDPLVAEKLRIPPEQKKIYDQITEVMEQESGLDAEAALANMRFTYITGLCADTVVRPRESKEHRRSLQVDKLLTGRYTAIPIFVFIMGFVFVMTFNGVGAWLTDLTEALIGSITDAIDAGLTAADVNPVMHALLIDGVISGVGTVIGFLPYIVTLYFFLSILEDTGYMARVAFVMDRLLRRIGLSGRSIVPLLVGFGCSVPAVMATRTLSSDRDRKMTILLTPFMSCSAKLPIYTLIIGAFFPPLWQAPVMLGLYLFGICCGILYALLLDRTAFRGEPVPFVMELPNYRLPTLKSIAHLVWEKSKGFVMKAFTIIFAASVIIWFLQMFDGQLNPAASPDESLLADIGRFIAPIFAPLGFGDWRVATAILTGFTAKETLVSTLTVLMGENTAILQTIFTPFTALVFLTFTLLYTPCVATIATVRREMGGKGALYTVVTQCTIAWCVAFLVHLLGTALGLH